MKYDFDRINDRSGTFALKLNTKAFGVPNDVIPLWVADMDFTSPQGVIEAMKKNAEFGIFGYADAYDEYFPPLLNWMKERFDWSFSPEEWVFTPGVVPAINVAVRAFTEPGDGVLVQMPVYFPFMWTIAGTGRKMVTSDLVNKDGKGHYEIDFDDFEKKIVNEKVKLFILCSPHNPVGRVWTKAELMRMAEICMKHGVLVVSDEIHMDFVYPGHKHTVFETLSPEVADITITCTAPSKTFNITGLANSNAVIKNKDLLAKFKKMYTDMGLLHIGQPGLVGCMAAYETGAEWLSQLLVYLEGNFDLIAEYVATWDGVEYTRPQGTFLNWLDFSKRFSTDTELEDFMYHKAKVWLNLGSVFGNGGEGHLRLNAASPKSVIKEALERMSAALK